MNTIRCPDCDKEFPIGQLHIVENGEDMFTCPYCGAEINVIFWFEEVNDYGDDSEACDGNKYEAKLASILELTSPIQVMLKSTITGDDISRGQSVSFGPRIAYEEDSGG